MNRQSISVRTARRLVGGLAALLLLSALFLHLGDARVNSSAAASIEGLVSSLNAAGISNARVEIMATDGKISYSLTNPAGRFRFSGLEVGQPYTITVTHKRFRFDPQTITLSETNQPLVVALPANTALRLDPGFGNGGKVITDFGANDRAHIVLPQRDGKIVVVGSSNHRAAIARYLSSGEIDKTYGDGGKVISPDLRISIDLNLKPAAVQADDKIVVGGSDANFDLVLERRNTDGSLDGTFGGDGVVTLDFAPGSGDEVKSVAVQPDGKVLAVGRVNLGTTDTAVGVARFNADGSLDSRFGVGGRAVANTANLDDPRAVSLQPDGKIVICGTLQNTRQEIVRFNADGTSDAGFGDNGISIGTEINLIGYDLAIQRNGQILGVGEGLVRYDRDGALDSAFNGPTGAIDVQNVELQAVGLRQDGMILAAGRSFQSATTGGDFGLALLHPFTGELVSRIDTDILTGRFEDPKDIFVQPDGKIVVAGYIAATSLTDFAIVRYLDH